MQNVVITISREYGSGGRLIGQQVAEMLGIAFYNRSLIDLTAQKSGLAKDYISRWEERVSSRFLWSSTAGLRGMGSPLMGGYYSNEDTMFRIQSDIIRELAQQGPCVIVGRCADYVLREHPHCLNVFIRSDLACREERLVNEYGVEPDRARAAARDTDKGRANYYRRFTSVRWGDIAQYHLVVDSGRFGTGGAACLIADGAGRLYSGKTATPTSP